MSHKSHKVEAAKRRMHAVVFAALGDATRLALIAKLCTGQRLSISRLAERFKLTRQATKHLRVLENAGIVHSVHAGRESLFEFGAMGSGTVQAKGVLLKTECRKSNISCQI